MKKNHYFHLTNLSPWPILTSLSILVLMLSIINFFYMFKFNLMLISFIFYIYILIQWWRDVIRESTFQGLHTKKVKIMMQFGMILFIISEILFFISFFWSFFHSALSPTIELGMNWPPMNINTFNPLEIPLLNTLILLFSGMTVTWSHQSLMENKYFQTLTSLLITVLASMMFLYFQLFMEYFQAKFNISDSIFGTTFFMLTGFHGLHVMMGLTFLMTCLMRIILNHFSSIHHFGFEAAIWYWHFIDIIWLGLYIIIYWWNN